MKKFLSGFLTGAIIFSMLGVFAVTYVANPVDFKVLVNGEEFVSDPPALEVEGRTYLPLRAMGDALGVPVNWNEELRQAEVGAYIISGYKTYPGVNTIIDFGDFKSVYPIYKPKVSEDGKLITYVYRYMDTSDYIEMMEQNGYTFEGVENDGFDLSLMAFYNDDEEKFPFMLGFTTIETEHYIMITIFLE